MARKGKLSDEMRAFVVREIAGFSTPGQIATMVNERFGVQITPQAVEKYDPTKNKGLSKRWREHHDAMRANWRERMEDEIPLANKFVRVRELAAIVHRLGKNDIAKMQALEQIAKETGNVHTNRRELSGPGGKPMQFEDVNAMTPEAIQDELRTHMQDPAMRALIAGVMGTEAPSIPAAPKKETKHG